MDKDAVLLSLALLILGAVEALFFMYPEWAH